MNYSILMRYGEIHLKGQNRPFFEKQLLANIKRAVKGYEGIEVERTQGRFYVHNAHDDQKLIQRLTRIFGIISVSPAVRMDKDMDSIKQGVDYVVEKALQEYTGERVTFKVESRRADKRFFMDSMTLSREMGAYILDKYPQLKVDVHNPTFTVNIEIREYAYIYYQKISGAGGMPIGTNGKTALLLSGGIDSPVAGWMVAKRGVEVFGIHFHSYPYTSDRAKQKVVDLCSILSEYCGPMKLYMVPFTEIQQQIYQKCPESQLTVLMRVYMMKIAEIIAEKEGAKALITGESIGQVASQTLDSLVVTNKSVDMPVIRPLIGFDKVEIVEVANKIGTYETSILPYEDCCTIFVPKHPVTHPKLEDIEASQKLIDGDKLIKEAIDGCEIVMVK
ncbi:tRNA uracil 4-sulfurtransferase ThiI [Xylanivirga thermophila]|uniref:tRNA uracil 4-sulfurtransferase ThiI n=1 Tax=Xylanivirga thermophila TaxID=2496273 RepID=UPI00101D04E6|nr:tRNA uracil 4-sulfurtransferase ThiI [Xylanivirga thermophila]